MKRSFRNLLMVITILASLIGSSTQVKPVAALGTFDEVTLGSMPNVPDHGQLQYGQLLGVWSIDADNIFTAGYGKIIQDNAYPKKPLIYQKTGGGWSSSSPGLPVLNWSSGQFNGVWGIRTGTPPSTTDRVFAVGAGGTLNEPDQPMAARWNGSTWTPDFIPLPTTATGSPVTFRIGDLRSAWGSSASDVHAVGYGKTYAGAIYPLVSHWNGSAWTSKSLVPSGWQHGYLYGIWGSASNNIYAVGNGGLGGVNLPLIYRYNGSSWSASSLSLPTGWSSGYLNAIWGYADSGAGTLDIYAAGSGKNSAGIQAPLLYHFNGTKWSVVNISLPATSWTQGELKAVWGSGSNVYAVGFGVNEASVTLPILYRKGRNGWVVTTYLPSGANLTEHYLSMSGSSPTDIYTVGFDTIVEAQYPAVYHAGLDANPPGSLTDLSVVDTGAVAIPELPGGVVGLTWTAPADDGYDANTGPADSYIVKYSTGSLSDCSSGDTPTSSIPAPLAPGTTQTVFVSELEIGTSYNFAVCAVDEDGRSSSPATTSATAVESLGMYDNTDSLWAYSTNHWTARTAAGAYNGTYRRTGTKGAAASIVFQGPAFFTFYYRAGPGQGYFKIYVDGVLLKTINAYSATTVWQRKYISPAITGNEVHTVMIKQTSVTGKYTDVDAIKFIPAPQPVGPGTYDDIHSQWLYSANWTAKPNTNAFDDTFHVTSQKGSNATFVFQTPARFVFYYRKGPKQGTFKIYVDGVLLKTINAYNATTVWQRKYTSPVYSDNKSHTIVIKHVGPTGKYVDIDAIVIE